MTRYVAVRFEHGLSKLLDSSAFVPDAALPPASMQAGLRRNDEMPVVTSTVIPAKAGIREGGAGLVNRCPALACFHKR